MFKRIRKFYRNNRIYCILMLISILCLIVLGTSVIIYFYNQSTSDKYGSRLENIGDYNSSETINKLKDFYKEDENVLSESVRIQGKIIYIDVKVKDEYTISNIESLASKSLEVIEDKYKEYYDIQFIFTKDNYPAYFGSKSSNNTIITWTNYNLDTEEETTTSKK